MILAVGPSSVVTVTPDSVAPLLTFGSSGTNWIGADCGKLSSQSMADKGRSEIVPFAKVVLAQLTAINTA
jgi:hypothetical protein